MDKKKGILNIGTSIISKVILLLVALYMRRLLIFQARHKNQIIQGEMLNWERTTL